MYADAIRKYRLQCGLSQFALGAKLGVSSVSVSKWERGQTQPDIHALTQMADIFGVTVDELVGHEAALPGENPNIHLMTRAFRQLTPDEQEKYIAVGRALFAHAFGQEDGK